MYGIELQYSVMVFHILKYSTWRKCCCEYSVFTVPGKAIVEGFHEAGSVPDKKTHYNVTEKLGDLI